MDHCRARFRRADRRIGDLVRRDRQVRRHRRRMDRSGDGAGDDDFAGHDVSSFFRDGSSGGADDLNGSRVGL
jgi:hypothetical protein